jgi:hypothetical protein
MAAGLSMESRQGPAASPSLQETPLAALCIPQSLAYGAKKSANAFGFGTPTPVTSSQPGAVFR